MRAWSFSPHYLDRKGLWSCVKETYDALGAIYGHHQMHRNHSGLLRFKAAGDADGYLTAYCERVIDCAAERKYEWAGKWRKLLLIRYFRSGRCDMPSSTIPVTIGQVRYEWAWYLSKLAVRSPDLHARLYAIDVPDLHPSFHLVPGLVEPWEKIKPIGGTP